MTKSDELLLEASQSLDEHNISFIQEFGGLEQSKTYHTTKEGIHIRSQTLLRDYTFWYCMQYHLIGHRHLP